MKKLLYIPDETNVGNKERLISAFAGSALVLNALSGSKSVFQLGLGGYLIYRGITGHCPAYEAVSKNTAEMKSDNINIKTSVTVNKPRHEVYQFWRQLNNLPLFMKHLEKVNVLDDKTSEWTARIPGSNQIIFWKSEIVKDEVNERIGWRSLEGSGLKNAGNVHFEDAGDNKTEIHAIISYHVPGGTPGTVIGRLFNPIFKKAVRNDIMNFKVYFETGKHRV